VLYSVWCISKSYAHNNNCKNNNLLKKEKREIKKEKKTNVKHNSTDRARGFNAGLLARSQFASGRFCDRPTRPRFSAVFLGPRANAVLLPKFHVTLHASPAFLPMVTLKISPCTNVTLTFDFDCGLDMGDIGEGALHREERK
jgi:hypothetical protein